jgi:hypothetical protein
MMTALTVKRSSNLLKRCVKQNLNRWSLQYEEQLSLPIHATMSLEAWAKLMRKNEAFCPTTRILLSRVFPFLTNEFFRSHALNAGCSTSRSFFSSEVITSDVRLQSLGSYPEEFSGGEGPARGLDLSSPQKPTVSVFPPLVPLLFHREYVFMFRACIWDVKTEK